MIKNIYTLFPDFIQNIIKYILFLILYKKNVSYKTISNLWLMDILQKNMIFWEWTYIWKNNFFTWKVSIWKNTFLNSPNTKLNWWENSKVTIGDYCSISWNVSIISRNAHNPKNITTSSKVKWVKDIGKDVNIWNDVWIGCNATILPWVNIGNGAIIWAWSVVTKDVPEFTIYAWNPARFIRARFDDKQISELNKLKYWEWEKQKIEKELETFHNKNI